MDISLRPVTANEIDLLASMSRETFYAAFGHLNTADDMATYAATAFGHDQLLREIATPGSTFFFAELVGQVTGFMKINTGQAQTEFKDRNSLEVERLYVLAQHQGKKIGSQMLEAAVSMAVEQGRDMIWLGVWERNANAIRLYERMGFVHCGSHDFMLGGDCQTDLLMCRDLK